MINGKLIRYEVKPLSSDEMCSLVHSFEEKHGYTPTYIICRPHDVPADISNVRVAVQISYNVQPGHLVIGPYTDRKPRYFLGEREPVQ